MTLLIEFLKQSFLRKKLSRIFGNKTGIEIGGPTRIFYDELPLYKNIGHLDGCNFSTNTLWEGKLKEGMTYSYGPGKTGYQYILEASNLTAFPDAHYDFLLASHCLEHCANCLKTVAEWKRVVRPGGYLLLVLPDKQFTFDHKRMVTSFSHLVEDLQNNVSEKDLTHYAEIMELHDLSMDIPAGSKINFQKRSLDNFNNRCLHHHVFDFGLLEQICKFHHLKVIAKKWIAPYHQVIIAQNGN